MKRMTIAGLAGAIMCLGMGLAAASTYPDKPIRLIVPYTPGGATDILAREVGQRLSGVLGQPVVIENRPGGSGNIGGALVARAAPDGYTLLLDGLNLATNPSLFRNMPFDPIKDLTPISSVALSPLALLVNPGAAGHASLASLVAAAKASPGKLTYASAGNGNPTHLFPEAFKRTVGIQVMQVPYKGTAPAMTDLMGGQVDMMFASIGSVQNLVGAGKLKALAVTGAKRSAYLPEVPTFAEAGYPVHETDLGTWWALMGPGGLPAPVVQVLNEAIGKVLRNPETVAALSKLSFDADPIEAATMRDRLQSETRKWSEIIHAAGVIAD
ncbi:Tripartite tricarboxylate transporter family receptor [Pigmentiphaga humi]|uniref:Tripartite tricarboxylate transporter family receptor n=1 Tax=Pigmentiphaga humi TaxID=2478468 RepID=A0A3P4B2K9_9BURK|nr:tripartite tricarboxylate transporter substrate binding protein [Pigmentiphaga humi]VCU70514.1 Tripartite tricarboxylate transporter family receptor [Pigmentiphaga humi]